MPARPPVPRVTLVEPTEAHASEFLDAVARSRALHASWVAPPTSLDAYRRLLERCASPTARGHLVTTRAGQVTGFIVISEIVRGAFRSGYLGYYAFEPYAGGGFMRAGLAGVIRRAFGRYQLHRLEANIQPANTRSRALVRGLGFRREGLSPRYLKIRGRWRDHERWALTVEDWQAAHRRGAPGRRRLREAMRRR